MATKLETNSIKGGLRASSGKRMVVTNGRITRSETGVSAPVKIKAGKKGN